MGFLALHVLPDMPVLALVLIEQNSDDSKPCFAPSPFTIAVSESLVGGGGRWS